MIYTLSAARVIGIVVLVIVIVVVVLLFFPVTYRLDANLDNRRVRLKIYWIFRLFRFRFNLEEELELVLTVLFFDINFLDEERRLRRQRRMGREIEAVERSTMQRAVGFARSSLRFLNLVREYELFQEAWPHLTLFMFRSRPRDISGHVEFGLRDPARTGEIIGAVAAIPVIYRTELTVTPDFEAEESYAHGEIYAKGHLMMLHALILLIRLISNKKVRTFIGALRHRE